jgi:hypothetical protein
MLDPDSAAAEDSLRGFDRSARHGHDALLEKALNWRVDQRPPNGPPTVAATTEQIASPSCCMPLR